MNTLKKLFRPLHLVLTAALVLGAGCSQVKHGEYYQLQADSQSSASRHDDTAVLLGPVKLADYLQREQILQRQADGRLTASHGRWAGSMDDEVGQLLLRQLAAQLGSSHVALYPDRLGVKSAAQLVVSISRLDSGVGQPAVLEAQWRLLDAGGEVQDSRILSLQAAHEDGLASQVDAQSRLLVELSAQLAEAVKHLQKRPDSSPQPSVREQINDADSERAGMLQHVEPPSRLEVFRF